MKQKLTTEEKEVRAFKRLQILIPIFSIIYFFVFHRYQADISRFLFNHESINIASVSGSWNPEPGLLANVWQGSKAAGVVLGLSYFSAQTVYRAIRFFTA